MTPDLSGGNARLGHKSEQKGGKMAITLKAARVNAGLTQREAAKRLGISISTLGSFEMGRRFPDVPQILKIEELYGVGFNELIFLPDSTIKS